MEGPSPTASRRLAELVPGMALEGAVTKVELFGAFVDVGAERDGLVHISMLRKERVNRVEDVVHVGQHVEVWVQTVDAVGGRLELTMIRPVGLKWKDIKPGLRLKGTVVKLEKFGAFVDVGAERPGLVHISEMSNEYVSNPAEVAREGQEVDVAVIDVDRKKRQIRLTMKPSALEQAEVEAEAEPEEAAVPTAMELALRQAMDDAGESLSQPAPGRRSSRPRARKAQEDILARTLKQRIK